MGNNQKVVLVTGASSGLGLATVNKLFENGCIVYAAARSYKNEVLMQVPAENRGVLNKVYLDVREEHSIEQLIRDIVKKEGRIDVLVNCAAILILGSVEDITMDEFESVIDTNLYGTIRMCRHVLPYMRERKKGLIINFSSGAGLVGIPFQGAYCSSKSAIEGFSEALRWEVKNQGIDVVIVEPGDCKSGSKNYRQHAKNTGPDTEVIIEGRKTVMIGSNNYLGLTSDLRVKKAAIEAVEKFGSGCSGSRFLNGTLTLHLELEKKLAAFVHKEAALTFSTGFQTNLGIITAITGRNDYILCDSENHASIVDGCRLSFAKTLKFEHNDMQDLERILSKIDDSHGKLIVVDGIFSMEGDITDLPGIVKLAKKYGARIMVDDAHSFGVIGDRGRGTAEYFGLEDEVDIVMSTFSKSLASLGGFMAAKQDVVEFVKHASRPFIFSASIPPSNAAAAIAALEIIEKEPQRIKALRDISIYMREGFKKLGIPIYIANNDITPIVPVMTWDNERTLIVTKMLREEGVYVNPVVAPAVKPGQCRIRTSFTATHTKDQLDYALNAFKKVFERL